MTLYCQSFTTNDTCPTVNGSYPPLSHSYSQFEYVTEVYIITIIAIFGLFGNTMSIIVMYKDKERREMLFLLQILAVADSFYLILCLLRYPLKYFVTINRYYMMQIYVFPTMKTAQTATVWAMLLVTVDRYFYICLPLKAQSSLSYRGRTIKAILLFVFAFIYNLPRFFDSCLMAIEDVCTNTTILAMVYNPVFNNGNIYLNVYVYGMYMIFLYLGPLLTLILLNTRLIAAIKRCRLRYQQWSVSDNHQRDRQRRTETNATMVLIIIIIIFIICETPELVSKLLTMMNSHLNFLSKESPIFNILATISTLLLVINSAVNFVVYLAYGKRFRWIMKQLFQCPSWSPPHLCCKDFGDPNETIRLDVYKRHFTDENHGRNGNVTHNTVLVRCPIIDPRYMHH